MSAFKRLQGDCQKHMNPSVTVPQLHQSDYPHGLVLLTAPAPFKDISKKTVVKALTFE